MTRARRRLLACLGIRGIAFAQIVATAHACTVRPSAAALPGVALAATGEHCAGAHQQAQVAPSGNVCEVQCSEGTLTAPAPDVPYVALAPLPLPPAPATIDVALRDTDVSRLVPTGGAPPPHLRFARLLN
jgi:hypothetical protein